MNKKKNPWTINSLAAIAGEIMFKDTDYINATKELIFPSDRESLTFYPNGNPSRFMNLSVILSL